MAKPIRPIPTLTGKDAIRFVRNMLRENNREPTEKDREMFKEISELSKRFSA